MYRMTLRTFLTALLLAGVLLQNASAQDGPSARKAFALSLLVPGAGHHYAAGGDWNGRATAFALAEAGLWTGLVLTIVRRNDLVTSYESLASARAGAMIEGKERSFFLNIATYRSSDDYRDAMLRSRAWDQVEYVDERVNQWRWTSEDDFLRYREIRDDAESLGRRRTILIAAMGANRLISGISAARIVGRQRQGTDVSMSLDVHPASDLPLVALSVTW